MSVPTATAAASARPRKDSRTTSPKVRSMTPKQSGVEGLEEFQRKRRHSSKSAINDCCVICILLCLHVVLSTEFFNRSPGWYKQRNLIKWTPSQGLVMYIYGPIWISDYFKHVYGINILVRYCSQNIYFYLFDGTSI